MINNTISLIILMIVGYIAITGIFEYIYYKGKRNKKRKPIKTETNKKGERYKNIPLTPEIKSENLKQLQEIKKNLEIPKPQDKIYEIYCNNKLNDHNPIYNKPTKWDIHLLKELEWKRFEIICTEYLKLQNRNAHMTGIGADGGVDIRITDDSGNTTAIAQCKAYNDPIKVNQIREFYGTMMHEKVETGFFLTTSNYTKDAESFALDKKIFLIRGNEIVHFFNKLEDDKKTWLLEMATAGDYTTPTCPNCDIKLVQRHGNAGRKFWGCRNYPKCKTTLHIRTH